MRRQTRPRAPNQRTCKHNFYKLYGLHEDSQQTSETPTSVTVIEGRRGAVLVCAKCALVRSVFNDGTMVDGPVQRTRTEARNRGWNQPPTATIGGGLIGGAQYTFTGANGPNNTIGAMGVAVADYPRTAAQRLDDAVEPQENDVEAN